MLCVAGSTLTRSPQLSLCLTEVGASEGLLVVCSEELGFLCLFLPGFQVEFLVSFVQQLGQFYALGLDGMAGLIASHCQLDWFCLDFGELWPNSEV